MHVPGTALNHLRSLSTAFAFGLKLLCLAAAFASSHLPAQTEAEEGAPDLRTLKAQLRRELLAAALPEQKAYRDALQALEKKHADAQDYASALRVREERVKIDSEIATAEKEIAALTGRSGSAVPLPKGRIQVDTKTAVLTGVRLDAEAGALVGWQAPGASAVWQLPNLPPGGYEVFLVHLGGPISIILKESFYSLNAELRAAPGKKPVEQNVGTLRIRDGAGPLTLTVGSAQNAAGLHVLAVWLVPSAR